MKSRLKIEYNAKDGGLALKLEMEIAMRRYGPRMNWPRTQANSTHALLQMIIGHLSTVEAEQRTW